MSRLADLFGRCSAGINCLSALLRGLLVASPSARATHRRGYRCPPTPDENEQAACARHRADRTAHFRSTLAERKRKDKEFGKRVKRYPKDTGNRYRPIDHLRSPSASGATSAVRSRPCAGPIGGRVDSNKVVYEEAGPKVPLLHVEAVLQHGSLSHSRSRSYDRMTGSYSLMKRSYS